MGAQVERVNYACIFSSEVRNNGMLSLVSKLTSLLLMIEVREKWSEVLSTA